MPEPRRGLLPESAQAGPRRVHDHPEARHARRLPSNGSAAHSASARSGSLPDPGRPPGSRAPAGARPGVAGADLRLAGPGRRSRRRALPRRGVWRRRRDARARRPSGRGRPRRRHRHRRLQARRGARRGGRGRPTGRVPPRRRHGGGPRRRLRRRLRALPAHPPGRPRRRVPADRRCAAAGRDGDRRGCRLPWQLLPPRQPGLPPLLRHLRGDRPGARRRSVDRPAGCPSSCVQQASRRSGPGPRSPWASRRRAARAPSSASRR